MPIYSCITCNYSTKYKSDYKKHLNTKKHYHKNNGYNIENDILGVNIQKHPKTSKNIQKHPKNIQKHPKTSKNIQ